MDWNLVTGQNARFVSGLRMPSYIPVVAEVGINHNGDTEIAKRLIALAAQAGCDAVKFQKRSIDTVYPPNVLDAPRQSPWGETQRDQKYGLELNESQYAEIDRFCRELNIDWSASAWDLSSLEFVESFEPPFHKIASAMLTHSEFVAAVAKLKRPTLISTGMATFDIIDDVVAEFSANETPFALLHTVSTYPTPEEDVNLAVIGTLRRRYGTPVGYSGHEASVSPSIVAAALGAQVIERHITLDRSMYGSDQAASLEEAGLRQLVEIVRKIPTLLGSGVKNLAPGEIDVAAKLRYWES